MDAWVLVGLWDGVMDVCYVFDDVNAVEDAFEKYTGVSDDDYNKAWDEAKEQGIDFRSHPLMDKWDHHVDAWVVQTTMMTGNSIPDYIVGALLGCIIGYCLRPIVDALAMLF